MVDHERILRDRGDLNNKIIKLTELAAKLIDPRFITLELKGGSKIQIPVSDLPNGFFESGLQQAIKEFKAQLAEHDDRISKWM